MQKENLITLRKSGFTLAEVLITITIIGIVAAVVLPTIVEFSQEKIWTSSSENFKAKLNVALKTMNVKGELARLESTEEFVENLKRNFRVVNVCKGNELDKCFDKKISHLVGGNPSKPVALSELIVLDGENAKAKNLGHADWESNVLGIQFPNGVSGLIAYNDQSCNPKQSKQSELFNCIALAYDVNANASPNTIAQDILDINAPIIGVSAKAAPPCQYYSENPAYCFYVIDPLTGIDCTQQSNAEVCRKYTYSQYNVIWSENLNNRGAVRGQTCDNLGIPYSSLNSALYNAVIANDPNFFINISAEHGNKPLLFGPVQNGHYAIVYPDGTANLNGAWAGGISSNTEFVGVCYKAAN